jgi:hypothetical protein
VEKREDEFQNLKQGGIFVAKYTTEFNCLSKYYPRLVNTEQNRTTEFIKGLRPELRRVLAPFSPSNYSTAVEAATRTENEDKLRFEKFPNKRPFGQQGNIKRKQTHIMPIGSNSKEKTYHTCKKKGHLDKDCWFKNKCRRCFNCGNSNHKKDECPKLNQFGLENTNMSNNENREVNSPDRTGGFYEPSFSPYRED